MLACSSAAQQAKLLNKILNDKLSVRQAERIAKGEAAAEPAPSTRSKAPHTVPEASVLEAQNRLSDYLNTTVSVNLTAKRGKITIDFALVTGLVLN